MDDSLEKIRIELGRKNYKEKTIISYVHWLKNLLDYWGIDNPLEISNDHINEYLKYLIKRKNAAARTIHQAAHAYKIIYNKLYNKNYQFTSVNLPKRASEHELIFLDQNEIYRFLNNTPDEKFYLIFSFLYSTGMSTGELINLKVDDIDFHNDLIKITTLRSDSLRKAILSPQIKPRLESFLQKCMPNKYLFEFSKGRPLHESTIQKAFKKILGISKIAKKCSPRSLRYSFVVHLNSFGVPLKSILSYLIFSTGAFSNTINFYGRLLKSDTGVNFTPLEMLVKSDLQKIDTSTIQKMLVKVKNIDEKDLLLEALQCIEIGSYRAAVIFVWVATMKNIYDRCVVKNKKKLNAAIKKYYPNAKEVRNVDDFLFIKDKVIIEASADLKMFDKVEKSTLLECLNLRNKCAHPSKNKPKPSSVTSFMEELLGIIFT